VVLDLVVRPPGQPRRDLGPSGRNRKPGLIHGATERHARREGFI
jgi:hypothetical protein